MYLHMETEQTDSFEELFARWRRHIDDRATVVV